MSKKRKQYYIVIKERKPGLYDEWFGEGGAADQVNGVPEVVYRGFYTLEDATYETDKTQEEKLPLFSL